MLHYNPAQRPSVATLLENPFFQDASLSKRTKLLKLSEVGHVLEHGPVIGGLSDGPVAAVH